MSVHDYSVQWFASRSERSLKLLTSDSAPAIECHLKRIFSLLFFFYKFFRYIHTYIFFFLGNYSNNTRRVNNARLGDNGRGTYIFQHCTKIVGTITKWAVETKSALHVTFAVHFAQIGLAQLNASQLGSARVTLVWLALKLRKPGRPGPDQSRPNQRKSCEAVGHNLVSRLEQTEGCQLLSVTSRPKADTQPQNAKERRNEREKESDTCG